MIEEAAPAKVNLLLHVGPVRHDGLHEICSLFASIDLADTLWISESDTGLDEVVCPGVEGPNLAAAALEALRQAVPAGPPPLRVEIHKRIPVAAGLGGGSADAAAVLRAANRLGGSPLDAAALRRIGARLGADVPSQVEPGHALVTGAGEVVEPVELPAMALVLVAQDRGLSTAEVYGEADRAGLTRPSLDPGAVRALAAGPLSRLAGAARNDLQPAALSLRPDLRDVLSQLSEAGALAALVTGSGPTAIGLFRGQPEAERAAEGLPRALVAKLTGPPAVSGAQIGAAVVAAALAAYLGLRRSKISRDRLFLVLGVAIALAVYASGVASLLPDPEKLIEDLATTLGPYTYALVAVMAFAESGAFLGFIAPGEFTVIFGGVVAGQGEIDIVPLIGLTWLSTALGDSAGYAIGRRLGRPFLLRHGPKVRVTPERLERVEEFFEQHGGPTIVLGRFLGFVRPLMPFIAGSSRMPYGRFLPFSLVGTGVWSATFCLLGFVFYRSFSQITDIAGQATLALIVVVIVVVGAVRGYRRLRDPDERRRLMAWLERQGRRPLLRPLVSAGRPAWQRLARPLIRVIGPEARFIGRRLTPGDLGIEFTTALAVAAVGLYVFLLYLTLLTGDPGLTPLDDELLGLADDARTSAAVDVVKVVTHLGSLPVAAVLLVLAGGLLVRRGHRVEASVLLLGALAIYAGVHLTKAGVDRPRPAFPLSATEGSSYPSGHAAYSSAYVALAIAAAVALPGLVRRVSLVVLGLLLAGLIGLTRIYLRAHYWSDVAGGWGLGFGTFALCAVAAMVVVHLRQNHGAPP